MAEETIRIAAGEPRELELAGLRFRFCTRAIGTDGGPSVDVLPPQDPDADPVLRFDLFRGDPHCHVPASDPKPQRPDILKSDDPLENWLELMPELLPRLIRQAGADELADQTDAAALAKGADDLRSAIAAAPEPGEGQEFPLDERMRELLGL